MKREFAIQQYYSIEPDAQIIDKELASRAYDDAQEQEQERQWYHRMFQAIIDNQEALDKVLTFIILLHHDRQMETEAYVSEQYGQDKMFHEVLTEIMDCFLPEDQARLREYLKHNSEVPVELNEILEYAFIGTCKPIGWNILEVIQQRKREYHAQ